MRAGDRSLRHGAGLLTVSVVLVGGGNYLYSLALTWLLGTGDYSIFATGQALLLVGATAASASAPWVLSQEIARAPGDRARRGDAVSFAILVGAGQAFVAACICALIMLRVGSPPAAVVVVMATFGIFGGSTVVGYIQGFERFRLIAGLRVGEVAVKIASGLGMVAAGAGVGGALGGFGVASLGLVVLGAVLMAGDLRLRLAALRRRRLWIAAVGLLSIQGGVAILAGLDIVVASLLILPGPDVASYQVSIILTRIPLFLSGALSMAVFPRLSAGTAASPRVMASSLGIFLRIAVPLAVITATIPPALVHLAFPADYSQVSDLLPITTVAGVMVGTLNIATTFFQAEKRFRPCALLLAAGILIDGAALVAGLSRGGIVGLAVGSAGGLAATVAVVTAWAGRLWPGSVHRPRVRSLLAPLGAVPLVALRGHPVVWVLYAVSLTAAVGWGAFRHRAGDELEGREPTVERGLRILHLAFEDHLRPGSGGGAVRTREINRRLGQRHRITVVTSRYRGALDRVEDGVRHVHIGATIGHFGSLVTYHLALPLAIRRHPSDLVVEDFAAPVSSSLAPLWTRRPVVGVAQWLFARQKSRQYHLPFFLVERLGVCLHRRVIAVSTELAARLREMNPRVRVDVIPNGVHAPPRALSQRTADRSHIVYLGRIEIAQKGMDMLVKAFATVMSRVDHDLLIAGDGPDLEATLRLCRRHGVEPRVRFLGRVEGHAKDDLLGGAAIVCVPSRYETFGMVAVEALACGAPVVAFDIPCLREVVPPECGVLVPAFDLAALGEAMVGLLGDPQRRDRMGEAGRRAARRFDWDELALRQEEVYLEAAGRGAPEPITAPICSRAPGGARE